MNQHRNTGRSGYAGSKKTTGILLVLVLILAAGLGAAVFAVQRQADSEVIAQAGTSEHAEREATALTVGEEEFPLKKHLSTLLVIGTDAAEGKEGPKPQDGATYNMDLADFMAVLVFDDDAQTVTPLQINRDTICEVPWLSLNGKVAGYETQQITYAHTYGSGGKDSAYNCARAVSRLLYKAPVDDYISFTMDAIPLLNDLVGGVTVTLTEDLPTLGDEYVAGAEITLKGQAAERFVRYRDTALTDSNLPRMARHRQYLNAFIPQAKAAVAGNEDFVIDAFKVLDPYICTDLTVNDISALVEKLCNYTLCPTLTYDGEYLLGQYAEFYPDEDSLGECVKAAFCVA